MFLWSRSSISSLFHSAGKEKRGEFLRYVHIIDSRCYKKIRISEFIVNISIYIFSPGVHKSRWTISVLNSMHKSKLGLLLKLVIGQNSKVRKKWHDRLVEYLALEMDLIAFFCIL